jgi:hypothetical protein
MPGNVYSESQTTAHFNEIMQTLWPSGVNSDVLLPVTDTAPHMRKAAGLAVSYPKLMLFLISLGRMKLSPLGTSATN